MSEESSYAKAKRLFEGMKVGERTSCQDLADKVGANAYQQRKQVAAFLSQQAGRGRVRKHVGEDRRTYYEKLVAPQKPTPRRVAPKRDRRQDIISLGEIGAGVVQYIQKLQEQVANLEKERDEAREKLSVVTTQREELERLYQEAKQRIEVMSEQKPMAQRTVRLSEVLGESA